MFVSASEGTLYQYTAAPSSPGFALPPSVCAPGVGGDVSRSVPGPGDGSGPESGAGLPGASAEPQPNGGSPRRPRPSRRQAGRLLSAV